MNNYSLKREADGSYNPTYAWGMPQSGAGNATKFQDLTIHPSDGGYMLFCIIFIHLGSAGVFLNWRAFYSFFHLQTVRNGFDTPMIMNNFTTF